MPRLLAILCALAAAAAVPACRRGEKVERADVVRTLPDVAGGFVGAPMLAGADYVRRTYTRGRTRIDVTLARAPLPSGGFDDWVRMSREAFPQAALDAPAADANGFYQCTEHPAPSCDLLIQLRSGVHIEIRGAGTSSREDVDALARALPLRQLAVAH